MEKDRDQIRKELDAKIPRDCVSQREGGGGKSFSYLAGHYVIARLNEVLGQGNWSCITEKVDCVHTGVTQNKFGKDVHNAHYIAVVKLEVPILGCIHSDVGYGDGTDSQSVGKAHELAAKEAVTDALKRAAKNLGMSMGLALYDKTQENVDDGESTSTRNQPAVAQGPAPKPAAPKTVAPVQASVPASTKEKTRDEINSLLTSISRVAISKKLRTSNQILDEMEAKYSVRDKAHLTDTQAEEFLSHLRTII